MSEIQFHQLEKEQWHRVAELEPHCPSPDIARCFVAEQNGEIIGYWFQQLALCCEPLLVHPEHRSLLFALKLYALMQRTLKQERIVSFVVHIEDEQVIEYAWKFCMEYTDLKAFVGKVVL